MKSKKIIALALTAAIAISAASMTAFAKSIKYNTDSEIANPENRTATVTLTTKDDKVVAVKTQTYKLTSDASSSSIPKKFKASIDESAYAKLDEAAQNLYEKDVVETQYYILFKDIGLDNYTRTITKQQFGWVLIDDTTDTDTTLKSDKPANSQWTTDADPSLKDKVYKPDSKIWLTSDHQDTTGTSPTYKFTFQSVGRTDTKDDNIAKNKAALDAQASKDKAAASREEQLAKLDEQNGALNNVNTGSGVETQKAKVTGRTAAADVAEEHDLKVAGLDAKLSNLAWVYEVTAPDGLIKGKTARAQLELPDGYTTTGYKVAVYHIKGWCSAEKVKGVSVGTNDVAFWANDFSPYILVLTPSDAIAGTSTGNPSTGDFSAVPVAMLAAAALGATGFVAYKKRKAE